MYDVDQCQISVPLSWLTATSPESVRTISRVLPVGDVVESTCCPALSLLSTVDMASANRCNKVNLDILSQVYLQVEIYVCGMKHTML